MVLKKERKQEFFEMGRKGGGILFYFYFQEGELGHPGRAPGGLEVSQAGPAGARLALARAPPERRTGLPGLTKGRKTEKRVKRG